MLTRSPNGRGHIEVARTGGPGRVQGRQRSVPRQVVGVPVLACRHQAPASVACARSWVVNGNIGEKTAASMPTATVTGAAPRDQAAEACDGSRRAGRPFGGPRGRVKRCPVVPIREVFRAAPAASEADA